MSDVFAGLKKAANEKKDNNSFASMSFAKMIGKVYGKIMIQETDKKEKEKEKKVKRKSSRSPSHSEDWDPPAFSDLEPYTTTVMVRLDSEIDVQTLHKYLPVLKKDNKYASEEGAIVGKRYLASRKISAKDSKKGGKEGKKKKNNSSNEEDENEENNNSDKENVEEQLPCFPHQVTIKMVTALNTPTIRVFPTNIAIVGCKNTDTIGFVCDALKEYIYQIEKVDKVPVFLGDPYDEITYTVNMCNYNFSLGFLVDRQELYRRVENMRGDFIALFNPTFYSGVMLKHKCRKSNKDNTIIVFFTGSVIFSCKHDQEEAKEIYNKFIRIITKLRPKIELKSRTKTGKRAKRRR